jgi:phenylacetate-CoA ligase
MGSKPDYFNKAVETMPAERMGVLQWERLRERLGYLENHSSFYQEKLKQAGLSSQSIQDLDEFKRRVPFTTKEELQEHRDGHRDPYAGLLCVPPHRIVHLVRTAGTTGVPTIYGLTEEDLRELGEMTARLWYQLGARGGHTVAVATMGTWNSFAVSLVEGLRAGGITRYHFSMPVPGEAVFPIEILPRWMKVEGMYLSSRPVWQVTETYGERLKELLPDLRYLLMAGQRVTRSFRRGIESIWGCRLFEAYTMTDAGLPAANCTAQSETFHFPEDAFLVEVIDPDTAEDLTGTGRVGEIVVTSLALQGTPLLRFRSGDMGFTASEPCPCGRTGMRLGISERMAHAVSVGDRTVFSSQVEEVLYAMPEFFLRQYYLVRRQPQPQDTLILRVERPSGITEENRLKEALGAKIREAMGVDSAVEFISEGDEKFVALYKFLKVVDE